ncbi:metallophosphoesterase [Flavobacteriaceae bacterium]|jgi:hypothetical protein|nr:metallophosphoesterase [Flavobacteriaceae bacterium]|tara:strand:- start:7433 stop:9055 length:1623 start_codon:yes stop_codon:yes gene_type:complete
MISTKSTTQFFFLSFSILFFYSCQQKPEKSYLKAPFTKLDTLSTNDWWNRGVSKIIDMKVDRDKVIAFGIYTTSNNTLKLSAQLFPLYPKETRSVRLAIYQNDRWEEVQTQEVNELGWSAQFRIENWDMNQSYRYKLLHGSSASFEGLIRKDPIDKKEIKLAALSCNSNKDRGDRENYVKNINALDPDLVFFAGDQSYDHKEHTAAWLKFGIQFREVFRTRPAITIPDDHDIGQGNLWGENGKKSLRPDGNDGGYFFHPEYVKMVERAQTSHLPDPFHKEPLEQGIKAYFTNLVIGGIDFAIIEDRKFKSGPNGKIPLQGPRADHILNPDYNPDDINLPELKLLGDLQLNFLKQWGENTDQNRMKAVLSATGFCGGAHLHGKQSNRLHADLDSNGWPQNGRDKALELIKKAGAVHIAGDQHLPTLIKHGITEFDDGPWAFVVPAIINNYYSRWWWPEDEKPGKNANNLLPWTGQYLDGFNNKITMHAYANPDSDSNGSGFGFIRFDTSSNEVTFECWPRNVDVTNEAAKQFLGWPLKVKN